MEDSGGPVSEGTYELMDAGDEQKLERIGPYLVSRQAAGAFWPKATPQAWANLAAVHHRSPSGGGHWDFRAGLPETWTIGHGGHRFIIKLTAFGHIGLFPEQRENWDWLAARVGAKGFQLLNLFGYTGGSSLAAAAAGSAVTHVDASRGVVAWASENLTLNGHGGAPVRWIVDDVVKFVHREVRRKSRYHGVVLDPPSYGRGPRGQVWKVETDLVPLLESLRELLTGPGLVLLSCHTPGHSAQCLVNQLHRCMGLPLAEIEAGEMSVPIAAGGMALPSGTFARWCGIK